MCNYFPRRLLYRVLHKRIGSGVRLALGPICNKAPGRRACGRRLVRTGGEQQREQEAGGVGRLRAWFARRYPRRCTTRRIAGTARASAQCVRVRCVRPERGKKKGRMPFRRTLLARPGGRWSSGGAACFGSGDDTTRHDPTLWRLQSCDGEHRLRSGSEAKRAVARGPKRDRTTTKHDRRGGRGDWGEWDEESRDRTGQTGDKRDETRHDETRTHARTHARGLARQVQREWVMLQDNAGAEKRGGRWRGWAACARAASSSMQGVVAVVQASCFRSEAHGEAERERAGGGAVEVVIVRWRWTARRREKTGERGGLAMRR